MTETVLVSTWEDGLFVLEAETRRHELAGQSVCALTSDGQGGALAIVDQHTLSRRSPDGSWSTIAHWPSAALSCSVAAGDRIFVGTDDARVLLAGPDGKIEPLPGFDSAPGRESWFAGTAIVDGKTVGPPLGVRSISATRDGSLVLANVHVGGIPRSTDGGQTWQPTIDLHSDIHEVRVHPTRPGRVAAAGAVGLCTSRDAGVTWQVETAGLHGHYCSAVAFVGDDVLVAASEDHFAPEGALYRRSLSDPTSGLQKVQSGLPRWCSGIIDTHCIAAHGVHAAAADCGGSVYGSDDAGRNWFRRADGLPKPSSVLIVPSS